MNFPYLIAEMACSHEGDKEIAKKIVSAAGHAQANAIQFQVWKLSNVDTPSHPDFEIRSKIEVSHQDWKEIYAFTRKNFPLMDIIACVYENNSAKFCADLGVDAFKIHGMDLDNPFLLKNLAKIGKRIDLSIGGSSLDEITLAIDHLRSARSDIEIWLMYGLQSFPTKIEDANLSYLKKLQDLFGLPMGYQDHCAGDSDEAFWIPAAAVGSGINIIEKHITHDRSFEGVDYESALNPDEFRKFSKMLKSISLSMGNGFTSRFSDAELNYRKYAKKSIVYKRDLSAGENITLDDVCFLRAASNGLPPSSYHRVMGKKLIRDKEQFDLVLLDDMK